MAGRAEGASCPILDTHTPESEQIRLELRKWVSTRVSRRVFSRVMLGLCLPGRYYFLTLTSSPDSPDIQRTYTSFRMYLKRRRPGICWCHVFTDEGYGVLHMVIRLKPRHKNLDIVEIREWWQNLWEAAKDVLFNTLSLVAAMNDTAAALVAFLQPLIDALVAILYLVFYPVVCMISVVQYAIMAVINPVIDFMNTLVMIINDLGSLLNIFVDVWPGEWVFLIGLILIANLLFRVYHYLRDINILGNSI